MLRIQKLDREETEQRLLQESDFVMLNKVYFIEKYNLDKTCYKYMKRRIKDFGMYKERFKSVSGEESSGITKIGNDYYDWGLSGDDVWELGLLKDILSKLEEQAA
jgi:hypothetical protein